MSGRNSTEADDVLEFLESLPESSKTSGDSGAKNSDKEPKKDTEILDFLDELEQSNLSLKKDKKTGQALEKGQGSEAEPTVQASSAPEEPAVMEKPAAAEESVVAVEPVAAEDTAVSETSQPKDAAPSVSQADAEATQDELETTSDPITSFSNWWSSSGSATVNSFFSKTAEQATHLKDRLAQEQHGIASKLQNTSLGSKINTATLSTLAKNLSRIVVGDTDEVLRIHLVHDLINYPLLSYHVEQQFDNVLSSQVQSGVRIFVDEWDHPIEGNGRVQDGKRHLNMFTGKVSDGEKLAFANLNNAIKLFTEAKDELAKQRFETGSAEENEKELTISDVFISILPISVPEKHKSPEIATTDSSHPGNFAFTIVLKDVSNDFTSITRSQGFPQRWADWLEGTSELKSKQDAIQDRESKRDTAERADSADDSEGIDPSDWVKEWVEDGLSLAFGVVAQNYVIDRMGF
ncbi:LAQU0S18e00716g1_1 [Lachancea quebecensis]|uniref:LAQU0S18e00716g1_1 n=1 Tax=Lachancea quebecensis TaxID=1654605 RepID=A0A0P1L4C0_9SACH|nr:LAQU0S18e00716g1_1 [Lachancea quebecensis]